MDEIEEKVERLEKVLLLTLRLAKAVKRAHNQVTGAFNKNFEVFDKDIDRNTVNIDKIVETLKGLVGDAAEWDKEHPEGKIANKDIEMMFL